MTLTDADFEELKRKRDARPTEAELKRAAREAKRRHKAGLPMPVPVFDPPQSTISAADHAPDCEWHIDQYPWECTCGAIPKQTSESPADVVGHKTFHSPERGYWHEPLTRGEAEELWEAADKNDKRRKEEMPDETAAVRKMFDAWQRLKDLGWNDACYCPKDGSSFLVIEPGSTGFHRAHYSGEWPKGTWWIEEDHDLSPSRPILWKPL